MATQTIERTGAPPSPVIPRFRAGDRVIVRTAEEIMATLDENGTLDGLPLMPEMLPFCGREFRVLYRVVQACVDGAFLPSHEESYVREFHNDDVYILQGVRCNGASHDGCQRGCSIFWKAGWLKPASSSTDAGPGQSAGLALAPRVPSRTAEGKYFCQSTQFLKATRHLSGKERLANCLSAVAAGNVTPWAMAHRLSRWAWWRIRTRLFGEHARGKQTKTPAQSLGLQPGELVQIKSIDDIVATLNEHGRNRGLHFSGDQRPFCGGRYRVYSRADNIIAEGIGEMKHFKDTVILEDVACDSAYYAFGGCYRADLIYWREIWLRRVSS